MKKIYLSILIILSSFAVMAQETPEPDISPEPTTDTKEEVKPQIEVGEAVVIDGKEVLRIYAGSEQLSTKERSLIIQNRLISIKNKEDYDPEKLSSIPDKNGVNINYDEQTLIVLTESDAKAAKLSIEELNDIYAKAINAILDQKKAELIIVKKPDDLYDLFQENKDLIIRITLVMAILVVIIIVNVFLSRLFAFLYNLIYGQKNKTIKSLKIKGNEILSEDSIIALIILIAKIVRLSLFIALIYIFSIIIFEMFPWDNYQNVQKYIKGIILTILTAVITLGVYKIHITLFSVLEKNILNWKGSLIRPLKIKNVDILSENQLVGILKKTLFAIKILINILIVYISIPVIFSYFEFTSTWADSLFGYILNPLKSIVKSFIFYLPNLFFISVIIIVNRYLIKLIKFIFTEIEHGNISFPSFNKEWANPTFKIVRSLILVFTLVVIFPYIPGYQSEAFKGVSIFLGVLFSLGSTSVIANIIAGTILTYMDAFKTDDFVQIGDTMGTILEKTMMVTRLKTTKNVVITIPNSIVMSSHIINFSTSKSDDGLILNTTITLGYDVPWRKVHEVLLSAAADCEGVKSEPTAFVLQTALNDFSVSYELNCYINQINKMSRIYSSLHQNIQDKCNAAGIEILSPHFFAARDGNQSTIPEQYLTGQEAKNAFSIKLNK